MDLGNKTSQSNKLAYQYGRSSCQSEPEHAEQTGLQDLVSLSCNVNNISLFTQITGSCA